MLEWYRTDADYIDALADTKALLAFVAREVLRGTTLRYRGLAIELLPVWECITVRDAFLQFAGWDPVRAFDGDRFDIDLVEKVEPGLPKDRPVILKDYPVEQAALAQRKAQEPDVAERWELYLGGIEMANAFTELTDAAEQRARFTAWTEERARLGKDPYPLDEAFLAALESGMPPCAGVALGVDRLVMLMAGAESLDDVCVE